MKTPISLHRHRQFSAATCALLFLSTVGTIALAEEPPPLRPAVVTGAGETAEKATEDALRNAVEQAVGALIDAKTMVEGEQVIQDKILRMSNAFVDKYDVLKRWSEGNLQYCRISAQVKSRELRATLAAEPIFKGKIEGQNLGAQVLGELNAKAGTGELFEQFLAELRVKTLFAKATGQPRPSTTAGSSKVVLQVPIEVGVDLPAYESIVESWLPRLRAAARSKATRSLSFKPMDPIAPDVRPNRFGGQGFLRLDSSDRNAEGSLAPKFWMGNLSPSNDINHSYFKNELNAVLFASREKPASYTASVRTVAVISGLSKSGRASVESLSIDKDVFCTLLRMIGTSVVLNAAVLDKTGKEVSGRSETFRARLLGTAESGYTYGYGTVIVVYPGNFEFHSSYTTTWNGIVSIPVASEELESLSSINLNIGVKISEGNTGPCQ